MKTKETPQSRGDKPSEIANQPKGTGQAEAEQVPIWKRLFLFNAVEESLETVSKYRPGGYHPVQLHDTLHKGRYRVIHKLGYGGFSTVWLCCDEKAKDPTYVAVKILVASESEEACRELLVSRLQAEGIGRVPGGEHICLPVNRFETQGPNGSHICLVYPVLGPSIASLARLLRDGAGKDSTYQDDKDKHEDHVEHHKKSHNSTLRSVSRQAVQALSALHRRGVCHGDFRPANILLKLQCLDGLDEEEVLEMLGKPETTKVRVRKSPSSTPAITGAPDHLVYPVDYDDADPSLISTEAYVTDFGQSFDISEDALPTSSGIPADYRAPEMVLGQTAGIEMDLWSLGCTLFEIRTGRRLFSVFQLLRFDGAAYLLELAPLLGKPPEAWLVPWKKKLRALLSEPDGDSNAETSIDTIKSEAARCRAIEEEIEASVRCTGEDCAHGPHEPISGDEARIFSDLLEKLLRWIPEERLASSKVLEHEWFKT